MNYSRYVALGDSFTEGVGDNDPTRPNGLRGWADRFAEVLATKDPDFTYANLAIRGRKLGPIIAEQLEPAIALQPDLITIHAGGNDVLRPKVDIDDLARQYDAAIARLVDTGAKVVMFTIFDPGSTGIYAAVRGRMALFNEWVREIAEARDVTLVDMWRMRHVDLAVVMDSDRMHMNSLGHTMMAGRVLDALGIEHGITPDLDVALPVLTKKEQRAENARWAKEFLGPWIHRRLTGRSSGDSVTPKRPALAPVELS
ncbi:MAG: SGNH/GDSL hydrolase family protein [Nocardioides sp.]|uniref:SGNH/GDSL hydrolase family protein n=1 Tax=Nocardioides sp. TaxID=35761 RepID=UPI003F0DA945